MRLSARALLVLLLSSCSKAPVEEIPASIIMAREVTLLRPVPNHLRAQFRRFFARRDVPEYCAQGAGHPRFGRDWCWERGYALGKSWRRLRVWHSALMPPEPGPRAASTLDLSSAVSPDMFERLEKQRLKHGLDSPLSGRWLESPYGRVLIVRSGVTEIAELADADMDGHAETLWLFKTPGR